MKKDLVEQDLEDLLWTTLIMDEKKLSVGLDSKLAREIEIAEQA